MRRISLMLGLLASMALGSSILSSAWGQENTSTGMPAEWRTLSVKDFAAKARAVVENLESNAALVEGVRSYAVELLLADSTYSASETSYNDLWALYDVAASKLTSDQRQTVVPRLVPSSENVSGWSLSKLQTHLTTMRRVHLPPKAGGTLVAAWLVSHDVNSISDPDALGQLAVTLNWAGEHAREFSACWTGSIKAPYDGAYTFSIGPIWIGGHDNIHIQQSMSVSIGGQQVLNASGDNSVLDSQPITLKAGQKTPLRMELSYRGVETTIVWRFPAVAKLSWQGPGIARQMVPSSALWSSDGTSPGVTAEYHLTDYNQQQTVTQTESTIDHVWISVVPIVPVYPELCQQIAARIAALALDTNYLAKLEANPNLAHFLLRSEATSLRLLVMLNSNQQTAFAEELLARPVLLQSASRDAIFLLYETGRIGSPDTMLHVFGKWSQSHPEAESPFCTDLFQSIGMDYYYAAYSVTWQYPPHADFLERSYLTLPDGGCCLPAAYILGTSYTMRGRAEDWIKTLDDQLKNDKRTGDQRASWLMARAWAEQLRHAGATGRYRPVHFFLAGQAWLEEACLTAQSEPARLRAYKELAVRLAGEEQFDAAKAQLDKAGNRCSSPDSAAKLAAWRHEIDGVSKTFTLLHNDMAEVGKKAYWNEIRTRRQQAASAGDQAAVSQYEEAMNAAGVKP